MAAYTTIDNPELYFQVKAYSGTGSSNAVTLDGDEDMAPNLCWLKSRTQGGTGYNGNNFWFDTVRGATKRLKSDGDNAESTDSNALTDFGSDGFTVGSDEIVNKSGDSYVAWCWKESATAGFDIVGYTGNETNRTISHSLSAVPKMIIQKNRATSGGYRWNVYHASNTAAPETDVLVLNENSATEDSNIYWNDTAPTSSVFSLGTSGQSNKSGATNIAYLWSDVQGFSMFGSYTGNGNADGAFIYTGFRPAFVLLKNTARAESWWLYDNKRDPHNLTSHALRPDVATAEVNYTAGDEMNIDMLSNGFKVTSSDGAFNYSGETIIYMAFAEAPLVNSNGVPCNAR